MTDTPRIDPTLAALLNGDNRPLAGRLSPAEVASFAKYITEDNIGPVQAVIGSDEDIEAILYWDRGGKFDDPARQTLEPVDSASAELLEAASALLTGLRALAVEYQRRSDFTQISQFNPGLLFTGLTGAVRCDETGAPDEAGRFFQGIELRLIGSVAHCHQSISLIPGPHGVDVHLGGVADSRPWGIVANGGDPFSLIQLAQLTAKDLPRAGFEPRLEDGRGAVIDLDPKTVRKAVRQGLDLGLPAEPVLHVSATAPDVPAALETAQNLARAVYGRFGLEAEVFNLGRAYGNFTFCRNETFDQILPPTPYPHQGLVLLTATVTCRRCRRELPTFAQLAQRYPKVRFALVNMNAPHTRFHERVFGDMAGGDPDSFRTKTTGATPFTIVYKPDDNGILTYADYLATGKMDAPPSEGATLEFLDRYFGE